MTDVHCHLTDERYKPESETERVIIRAGQSGIKVITNGTSVEDSHEAVRLAEKFENVWAGIGIHPEETGGGSTVDELRDLTRSKKVVTIGEIGLDFREETSQEEKTRQINLFDAQLKLATETGLPAIVHNRNADTEIIQIFDNFPELKNQILLHCFSGTTEFMKLMVAWGCYFSFGGMITYKRNDALRETLKMVPNNRLLIETDSPYLPPEPLRGTRNEPFNVKIVAEAIAGIRQTDKKEIEYLTQHNSDKLFKKMR